MKEESTELSDAKVPVSFELLCILLSVAEDILVGESLLLAQAMFLCAYAFGLRPGEYLQMPYVAQRANKDGAEALPHNRAVDGIKIKHRRNHNLLHNAIYVTGDGLNVQFHSEKTLKSDVKGRHRMIPWEELPKTAYTIMCDYIHGCPHPVQYFFVLPNGAPVPQRVFICLLDICLIATPFRLINITFVLDSVRCQKCKEEESLWQPSDKHEGGWKAVTSLIIICVRHY